MFKNYKNNKEELNKYLQTNLKKYKSSEENKFIKDLHFIPQNEYIWDDNGVQICKNILRQETLNDDFKKFSDKFNLGFELTTRENTSMVGKNLTVDDLDKETKDMIKEIYHYDFIKLGYEI